jgi:hypothetical protein
MTSDHFLSFHWYHRWLVTLNDHISKLQSLFEPYLA